MKSLPCGLMIAVMISAAMKLVEMELAATAMKVERQIALLTKEVANTEEVRGF